MSPCEVTECGHGRQHSWIRMAKTQHQFLKKKATTFKLPAEPAHVIKKRHNDVVASA